MNNYIEVLTAIKDDYEGIKIALQDLCVLIRESNNQQQEIQLKLINSIILLTNKNK